MGTLPRMSATMQQSQQAMEERPEVADDPTDLRRDDYIAALKRTKDEIKRDDVPSMAAGVAFKIFLSLFPAMLAALAIYGMVASPSDIRELFASLEGLVPEQARSLLLEPLTELSQEQGQGGVALVGLLGGLWAATSAAASLVKALNRAYETEESRGFLKQRLVALAITLALFATLAGLIVLLVAGPQITEALTPFAVGGEPIGWAFAAARFVLALALLMVLFAFVYWLGPNRVQPRWVWISPGAVLGVVLWLVVAGGFTLYVQTAGNYNEAYGSIGGVIVVLLWLQLSMMAVLIGAELNAEVERARLVAAHQTDGAGFALAGPIELATVAPADPAGSSYAARQTGMPARARRAPDGPQRPAPAGRGSTGPRPPTRERPESRHPSGPVGDRHHGPGLETSHGSSPTVRAGATLATAAALVAVIRHQLKR